MVREESRPLNNYHGTSQQGRQIKAIMPDHINVDERSLPELLTYASRCASKIRFYNLDGLHTDPVTKEQLNWEGLFKKDESIFLATLQTHDFNSSDKTIQEAFHNIFQLKDKQKQKENFTTLVVELMKVTESLFGYYDEADKLGEASIAHQIVREIDRVMKGDLGVQLQGFQEIYLTLKEKGLFPQKEEEGADWETKLKLWLKKWPFLESAPTLLSHKKYRHTKLNDWVEFAGGRLQEYYRRLNLTLSYLEEITPGLFDQSIRKKQDHHPDIGLLIAFLRLFAHAQEELNTFSRRHLEYYNKQVLGRGLKPSSPDKTIVCFQPGELPEGLWLEKGTKLLAGTNSVGVPSYYETEEELFVSKASIGSLSTLFVSKNPIVKTNSSYRLVTAIYAATKANSADGQGQEFTGTDKSWPVLGEDQFDLGVEDRQMGTPVLGFGLASSILLLKEGERKVTVNLRFTGASFSTLTGLLDDIDENLGEASGEGDIFNFIFTRPFRLFLTEEEGWMPVDKYLVVPPDEGASTLSLEFILPASAAAVSGYDPAIHGEHYQTSWPVLKVLLSDEEPTYSYSFLRDLELEEVDIEVQVNGICNLSIYNDIGLLDSARPFVPFGPLPRRGSYMLIGHPELFSKPLTSLDIDIEWAGLPEVSGGFEEYYQAYGKDINNESFKFEVSALTDYNFQPVRQAEREVLNMFSTEFVAVPPLQDRRHLHLDAASLKKLRMQPLYNLTELEEFSNATRTGYLKFELSQPNAAFGHVLYPRLFARKMAENARPRPFISFVPSDPDPLELPNEPYTPVINSIKASYRAKTVIDLRKLSLKTANLQADDRIFRLHPFGTELVFGGGALKTPFLLPRFDDDGYLYIGIRDLRPPSPLSLFFKIKESKKKLHQGTIDLKWHYLHHDEWRPFTPEQVIADSTVELSTWGIVQLFCPVEMTKGEGLFDAGMHWIRVAASGNLNVTGRCVEVIPQATEVCWIDNGDTDHLTTPPTARPPISGLAKPVPEITGTVQPISFYDGRPEEKLEEFYVRGSERLRHKNRGVNIWDYERLVLERFPQIQQVKCIGRHGYEDLLRPGQVMIVVIPHIDGVDISPKVGYHVLQEVKGFLQSLSGPFVDFRVINPVYEFIKVNCSIKPKADSIHKQGIIWKELHTAITHFICPWLREGVLKLGSSLSKTEVLGLINENVHVAFTTAFSMVQVYEPKDDYYKLRDTAIVNTDSELLTPSSPWSVLIPVNTHNINFLDKDEYYLAEVTAIDRMQLETDFVISETEGENSSRDAFGQEDDGKDQIFNLPAHWLQD